MDLIIDTCIFIKAERKPESRGSFHLDKNLNNAYITTITASELLIGVHYAKDKAHQLKRSVFVENILQSIPILDFTLEAARIHAELYAFLAKKGKLIGAHDLLIAATAITHNCALLTYNTEEFSRIPGLAVHST